MDNMRMTPRGRLGFLTYIAVIVLLFAGGVSRLPKNADFSEVLRLILPVSPTGTAPSAPAGTVKITKVIDGDTVETEDGKKVRYIGIDTPETKHPQKKIGCYGREASEANRRLVLDKYVRLEKDVSETDRYGRLLRYVTVFDTPEATGSGLFVNEHLVRQGYAYVSTYAPDVRHADLFLQAQSEAQRGNRGLWSACAGYE
jgi:micrococcal nuclease